MLPYTTPYHKFDLPIKIYDIEKLYVTYSQRDLIRIEKTLEDVKVIDEDTIMVLLSQEDTSHINGSERFVEAQLTVLSKDGMRFTSDIIKMKTGKVLKREVITNA